MPLNLPLLTRNPEKSRTTDMLSGPGSSGSGRRSASMRTRSGLMPKSASLAKIFFRNSFPIMARSASRPLAESSDTRKDSMSEATLPSQKRARTSGLILLTFFG